MIRLLPLILFLTLLPLHGENLLLQTELFAASGKGPADRSVNQLLEEKETQLLFSSRMLCAPGADSSCFLLNYFGSRQSGFTVKLSPHNQAPKRKNRKIVSELQWNFASEGPFQASGTEGFYEGTVASNTRFLLPGIFSPLGITRATSAEILYLPAITYHPQNVKTEVPFLRGAKWKLTLKITREGSPDETLTCVPVYHRGRFPVQTEPDVFQCRMYQHGSLTVLNAIHCYELGKRSDGSAVTQQVSLTLCLKVPDDQKELLIADLTSFCGAGKTAFGKLPGAGGTKLRYQFWLSR